MIENTFNFSGPFNNLHFSFLDSLPIQIEYPLMPISLTVFLNVARWVRPVKRRTCKLWFTLSRVSKEPISMSIRVLPTCENLCKLSTTTLVCRIMGKIDVCDTLYHLLFAICILSSMVHAPYFSSLSDHFALDKCRSAAGLVALSIPLH